MNKKITLILITAIPLLFSGCEKNEDKPIVDPKPLILPANGLTVVNHSNGFGVNLFRETARVTEGNLMLSPLSASTALTMLLNGCDNETYNQIHHMLGYGDLSIMDVNLIYQKLVNQLLEVDPKIKLAIANAVFYRNGFSVKAPFLNTLSTDFSAHVEGLSFSSPSALTTINGWANDNTFGKIPKVLDEISENAVMFLLNALYFKGNWTYQFDKNKTMNGAFTRDNETVVQVKMMKGDIKVKLRYDENCYAVELPYGRTNFSMVIIVPGGTLSNFIENFTNQKWVSIAEDLDNIQNYQSINLSMPKFKFEFEKVLNDQLNSLGMVNAFLPGTADLSGIADADIFVSFVKQNTFVDVNEEGTEAAAVTTIGVELTSMPNSYIINKPFVFIIRERTTNTLLFIGKVENPVY